MQTTVLGVLDVLLDPCARHKHVGCVVLSEPPHLLACV